MSKQDPTTRVSISLPQSQVARLDAAAKKRHVTRSALIREILRRLFASVRTPGAETPENAA